MNSTPRLLNRILIGILGLTLLVVGALLVLLATAPGIASWWQSWSSGLWLEAQHLFERTRFPGRQESWVWILLALLLVLLIGAMVAWIAQQGKGRADLILFEEDPGSVPGDVRIGGGVAEQALKAALADRPDLAGVSVAVYQIRGEPALRIRLQPRLGVAPNALAAEVSSLVEALGLVMGKRMLVLLHLGAGTRARFSRAERVR
jgi:hypothetical protein